jgi:hypothetical protein
LNGKEKLLGCGGRCPAAAGFADLPLYAVLVVRHRAGGSWFYAVITAFVLTYIGGMAAKMRESILSFFSSFFLLC